MNQRTIPWGTVIAGTIALGAAVLVGLTEMAGVSIPVAGAGPGAVIVVGLLILVTGLVVVLRSNRAAHATGPDGAPGSDRPGPGSPGSPGSPGDSATPATPGSEATTPTADPRPAGAHQDAPSGTTPDARTSTLDVTAAAGATRALPTASVPAGPAPTDPSATDPSGETPHSSH